MQYGNRTNYVNFVVLNYITYSKKLIFSDKVSIGWKGYVAEVVVWDMILMFLLYWNLHVIKLFQAMIQVLINSTYDGTVVHHAIQHSTAQHSTV